MNRIVGIYDLARSGGSLGTLLILLEELEIQRQIHSAGKADLIFVTDAERLIFGSSSQAAGAPGATGIAPLTEVAGAMAGIAQCHDLRGEAARDETMSLVGNGCVPWPDPEHLVQGTHSYDSTAAIQAFFSQAGAIPRLSVHSELLTWAQSYLRKRSEGRLPVAVHLKNNPKVTGQSNANLASWMTLFSCERSRQAHFFLLCDDAIDAEFRSLSNVTIASDDSLHLKDYLALIQAAPLFMGMMSGPANMALFGENPYLIFKNPDHHAAEMALELGDADCYPFALANQRVLRIWDTPENLIGAFEAATHRMEAWPCRN